MICHLKIDINKLLFHLDQGCQYTAKEFRDFLKIHNPHSKPKCDTLQC
ncbi:hypothetical protein IB642_05575 [Allofrancisella guangzhouensis]|nr:hypothetical protein [Allofrancisella guangzhouensis]MBK2027495.1 hypothetical protein [Allofrancisella guangzhouensis]MBK2044489.1 hypothetical protein [Allofrancisella guangzhouensis]MBK2045417.1 hypothetical protein [Allofrancisella guangzhouensis]